MVALEWGLLNPPYEHGVDRGVIHSGGVVKPWNGLISVDETEVDNSGLKSYMDGKAYVNQQYGGYYRALVTAYDWPQGFEEVIGLGEVRPGFHLAGQNPTTFDFSYRTMISDDEYKIHIVYTVLARQTKRNSSTLSEKADPNERTWRLDALPPRATAYRRSSHFVVDSTKISGAVLTQIENLLYGTVSTNPDFPTPEELLALF